MVRRDGITHQNGKMLGLVCNSRTSVQYAEAGLHTKMEKCLIWCVILEPECGTRDGITHQNGNKFDLVCNSRTGVWYAETVLHTKMGISLIWCVILERACSLQRPDYIPKETSKISMLRPRPGASVKAFSTPSSMCCRRHRRTLL